jgi:hypothetical protein
MTDHVTTLHHLHALVCAPDGPVLHGYQDAVDVIGGTYGQDVTLIVLPVERLTPGFFTLTTGVAGEIVQKFIQYGLHLVIVGDVSEHMEHSSALRAFVHEANRGPSVVRRRPRRTRRAARGAGRAPTERLGGRRPAPRNPTTRMEWRWLRGVNATGAKG